MTTRTNIAAGRRRGRSIAAALILVAWAGGLAALVSREFFRERSAIIAEAAMRLGPGSTYFIVEQDGRQIGFASTTIDTTGTTFQVVDNFIADLPGTPMSAAGSVDGDSAVKFVLRMPGQPSDTQRVAVDGPILVPTLLPTAAMLIGEPEVGKTVTLPSFDPRTMAAADVRFRFAAESLFVVTDSARDDAAQERFISARDDTVRAWKLEPTEGAGFSGWVDAQGNVVATSQPGGITLRRMAYEIGFGLAALLFIAATLLPIRVALKRLEAVER